MPKTQGHMLWGQISGKICVHPSNSNGMTRKSWGRPPSSSTSPAAGGWTFRVDGAPASATSQVAVGRDVGLNQRVLSARHLDLLPPQKPLPMPVTPLPGKQLCLTPLSVSSGSGLPCPVSRRHSVDDFGTKVN